MFSRCGVWNRVELEKNIGKIQKIRVPKVSEILPFFLLFIIFPPHLFLNFHGIQEVSGSIPLISTKQIYEKVLKSLTLGLFSCFRAKIVLLLSP